MIPGWDKSYLRKENYLIEEKDGSSVGCYYVDTLASCDLQQTFVAPGSAARRKHSKYQTNCSANFNFVPFARDFVNINENRVN